MHVDDTDLISFNSLENISVICRNIGVSVLAANLHVQ